MQPTNPGSPNAQPPYGPPRRKTPTWAIVLASCGGCAVLAVILIAVASYFAARGAMKVLEGVATTVQQTKADLKVESHKMVTDPKTGDRYVVGTLKNVSTSKTYDDLSISFTLRDARGDEMDSEATAETEEGVRIKPGAEWRFKAKVEEADAKRHELGTVYGTPVDLEFEKTLEEMPPEQKKRLEELKQKMKTTVDEAVKDAKQRQREERQQSEGKPQGQP